MGDDILATEASKSKLLRQRPLRCKTLQTPATGSDLYTSHDHHSNMNGMQGQNSRVPLPSLWCSLCHFNSFVRRIRVPIEYTGYRGGSFSQKLSQLTPAISPCSVELVVS